MFLRHLRGANFKNYEDFSLRFTPKLNCFTGPNGAGKTNLLDAIYYLCIARSYFNPTDKELSRHGQDFFRLQAEFDTGGDLVEVVCKWQQGKRKSLSYDDKAYKKLSEHIGKLPVVVIAPDDNVLILGGSEERRKFLDQTLSQTDANYLEQLNNYNSVLKQRNALLKKTEEGERPDMNLLRYYEEQLEQYGRKVYTERATLCSELKPYFLRYYQQLSDHKEDVEFKYQSHLAKGSLDALLQEIKNRDIATQRTNRGVHKDEVDFVIDGQVVKRFASQGQQKSFLISLKLAQYDYLKDHKQTTPLLLIDDIYDKLDKQRAANLLQLLCGEGFGQIFITDTHRDRIHEALASLQSEVSYYAIDAAKIS